jgi:hypothetical protein
MTVWVLALGGMACWSGAARAAVQPTTIQANATTITITVSAGDYAGKIGVYELLPNEADDAWSGKEPFHTQRVVKGKSNRIAVPRFEKVAVAAPQEELAPPEPKAGRRSAPKAAPRGPWVMRDRLYSKFVVAPAEGDDKTALMNARFVDDFSTLPGRRFPFPRTRSKKGLQVQMVDDAIALGVQHAALNVDVPKLFFWRPDPSAIPYVVDGETFFFNPQTVMVVDQQVMPLSAAGATVTLILLNRTTDSTPEADRFMRHPDYSDSCPNHLSAFNVVTDDGVKHYKAAVEFLIDRYTQPDGRFGRALGYIIGNEVNSHWHWYNMGEKKMEAFTEDYLRAMRIAVTAAEKICPTARVYMSLEHHWNARFDAETKSFPGRAFVDLFAKRAREQGDFAWHLAHHPYPDNLMEPAFWNDKNATSDVESTPKITFKNIELLPEYFRRPDLLYKGQPRHIILSEQGFHTKDGPEGETLQAAAFCAAYYKVSHIEGIDAFILHRHVDHSDEGGLKLGLWTRNEAGNGPGDPGRPRKIYEVFRLADLQGWKAAFKFAEPIVGIKEWDELLPKKAVKPGTGTKARESPPERDK